VTDYQIACVMPVYNNEKFVREAIDSILNQTYQNFHLVIVDDGSTDSTGKIIDEYGEKYKDSIYPKISVIHQKNGRTGKALNTGFRYEKETTNCPKELWAAGDNRFYPTMFETLNGFLDTHPEIDYVYGNTIIGIMNASCVKEVRQKNLKEEVDQTWNPDKFMKNFNVGIAWFWRKEIRLKAGEFFIHEPCEDYDMTARMVQNGAKFHFLDTPLAWFRRHQESMSAKIRHTGYAENLVKVINEIKDRNEFPQYIEFCRYKFDIEHDEERKNLTFEEYKKNNQIKTRILIDDAIENPIKHEKIENTNLENHFTNIYNKNEWNCDETRAGRGSSMASTDRIRNKLPLLFQKYNVKSVIDIGCNDLNWIKEILKQTNIKYIGADIVEDVIIRNSIEFPQYSFYKLDITRDELPAKSDLILCRDIFVHLSFNNIISALHKIVRSGSKYLLTTNFYRNDRRNQKDINIEKGISWRPVRLTYPFSDISLPSPMETINERCVETDNEGSYEDKSLALWDISSIAKILNIKMGNGPILTKYVDTIIKKEELPTVKILETKFEVKKEEKIQEEHQEIIIESKKDEKKEIRKETIKKPDILEQEYEIVMEPYIEKKWILNKIPKIAHFYWGNKTLPFLRYMTVMSFCKLNPDWNVRFYYTTNNSSKKSWKSKEHSYAIDSKNDCYDLLKKLPIEIIKIDDSKYKDYPEVFKSDLLRWSLLSNEGGFWSDMDVLYKKPMTECNFNDIKNKNVDTLVQLNKSVESFHTIGFLGSCENNEFYKYLKIKALKKPIDFNNYQSLGVILLNYDYKTMDSIIKKFPKLNFINIDFDLLYSFYPHVRMEEMFKVNGKDFRTKNSIGIHWYAGAECSGKFQNEINIENYKNFENTIIGKEICDIMSMR
jgi:glycosyltransferase involved in cell wall biosynthesis